MPLSMDEFVASLDPEEWREVDRLKDQFLGEERTYRQFREACGRARIELARQFGMSRDEACRLERQCDLLICTLRETIEAKGGSLSLVADFPDGKPFEFTAIGEHDDH